MVDWEILLSDRPEMREEVLVNGGLSGMNQARN